MAKQYYGCIRLTKHNPGWSDPINDIHLLRTHRTFKCVLEDYDLRPIIKVVKYENDKDIILSLQKKIKQLENDIMFGGDHYDEL